MTTTCIRDKCWSPASCPAFGSCRERHIDALNARMDESRKRFDQLVEKARAEGRDIFRVGVPSMGPGPGRMRPRF